VQLAAEFCAIHSVLEAFEYRAEDQPYFQALPIPETVCRAQTLGEIAAIFAYDSEELIAVNDWIWSATPETIVSGPRLACGRPRLS
jgi:hypothetical protein